MKFTTLGNRNAPAVLFFHARVGDGMMKMQIVKIGFGGRTMKETCFQNIRAVVMAQGIEKNIPNPHFPLFVKF